MSGETIQTVISHLKRYFYEMFIQRHVLLVTPVLPHFDSLLYCLLPDALSLLDKLLEW